MSIPQICNRSEPRFKVCEGRTLVCESSVDGGDLRGGTVLDLSPSGIRILIDGRCSVGQAFATELLSHKSGNIYCGIIRRVEPWVCGQSILGCQLLDSIPTSVLEDLSNAGIVNRRTDERIAWDQHAAMSWELNAGEIDIEIRDYSQGGMRIYSEQAFPENARLRIRFGEQEQDQLVVEATSIWKEVSNDGIEAGLQFIRRDAGQVVESVHQRNDLDRESGKKRRWRVAVRPAVAVTAAALLILAAATQLAPQLTIGFLKPQF